jgi:uncharacterized membrane protein
MALTQATGLCANCGAPIGTAVQASPITGQAAPSSNPGALGRPGLTSSVAGALAYTLGLITGCIFLVIEPYRKDPFVRFHAMQSIVYSLACIIFSIAWSIGVGILMAFNEWFALSTLPIRMIFSLGFFLLWLYAIYQAYNHREYHIPVIGSIAARHAQSQGESSVSEG